MHKYEHNVMGVSRPWYNVTSTWANHMLNILVIIVHVLNQYFTIYEIVLYFNLDNCLPEHLFNVCNVSNWPFPFRKTLYQNYHKMSLTLFTVLRSKTSTYVDICEVKLMQSTGHTVNSRLRPTFVIFNSTGQAERQHKWKAKLKRVTGRRTTKLAKQFKYESIVWS